MTTYEEISTCENKNFIFWSERAKLSLVSGNNKAIKKKAFRENMKNRRLKTYLEKTK